MRLQKYMVMPNLPPPPIFLRTPLDPRCTLVKGYMYVCISLMLRRKQNWHRPCGDYVGDYLCEWETIRGIKTRNISHLCHLSLQSYPWMILKTKDEFWLFGKSRKSLAGRQQFFFPWIILLYRPAILFVCLFICLFFV